MMIERSRQQQFTKTLKRRIALGSRDLLIRSQRWKAGTFLSKTLYLGMEQILRRSFSSVPGVESLYLAHGSALGEFFPGLSDFDLVIVFQRSDRAQFIEEIRAYWNRLRQIIPVRDLSLLSKDDFLTWQRVGGGMDPLEELAHWKCIEGRDLRISSEVNSEAATQDRLRYALASYQRLIRTIIKDERFTEFAGVNLRRQLYKTFCQSVVSIHPHLLTNNSQAERLADWGSQNGEGDITKTLLEMRENYFFAGEISSCMYEIAAAAYEHLDTSMRVLRISRPSWNLNPLAEPFNFTEIKARALPMLEALLLLYPERIQAVLITGSGSPRGYQLIVIPSDQLSRSALAQLLRHVHTVFRLYDDPWFNEHYPGAAPLVLSNAMCSAYLQLWGFHAEHLQAFPAVLYGTFSLPTEKRTPTHSDILEEATALSRYINQTYLERSGPALFDVLSLYYPRLALKNLHAQSVVSNEDAVSAYAGLGRSPLPSRMLSTFRTCDIDALLARIDNEHFTAAESLLLREHLLEDTSR